jgi:ankyrin repeat protein
MKRKHWVLLSAAIGLPLFLTNCMHLACMTGVTCIPYLGPPEWLENAQDRARSQRRATAYEASLTPLHRAIRAGDAAKVEEILQATPDQALVKTGSDQIPLELAVKAESANPRIVSLLLKAGAELDVAPDGYPRRESLLNQAVQVETPQPEIIALLLAAGAEGFVPAKAGVEYAFQTPFGHVIGHGASPELVDVFLRTRQLDPLSDEAVEYLEDAADRDWALERMLAYGVPLERAPGVLSSMVSRGTLDTLRKGLRLSASFDSAEWRQALADALKQAVGGCKFDMADILLERQGPNLKPRSFGSDLIRLLSDHCASGGIGRQPFPPAQLEARSMFLRKLAAAGANLNAVGDSPYSQTCPAWLDNGGSSLCELPDDIGLLKEYLALGADPYRLDRAQEVTAVGLALKRCKPAGADEDPLTLLLAQPPKVRDVNTQLGLDRSLNVVFGASCSNLVRLDVADRLIAYGANVNTLNPLRQTNIGAAMFYKDDAVYRDAAGYLLVHGTPVDAPDDNGNTALNWLLSYEKPRMERVLWLAAHGARLENVLNRPVLPQSLLGPDKDAIIGQIKAASPPPPP